ncbi:MULTISPECIES: NUDIX hydrolase [Falsihalocynthiibacter]|uniref:NUDIX hydrolase n=1 Tax=Falsihalocynthiibacter arcticus TaxID=1579316 RepID=A0A126UW07_9RHOB|nr:NUDIX hydrolase [Falsihalocynthiibacter arcticus]AML50262.1 NUDIX hydrolase [Falsihalocynthiibacter arcticus]
MVKNIQKGSALSLKSKYDLRTQFGAICYRVANGKIQILLITSRRSRLWIVPKGWPINGKTPAQSAAIEAWEEAGAIGVMGDACIGLYSHTKKATKGEILPVMVSLFALQVKRTAKKFPEKSQRKRKWVSRKKAASMVSDPELGKILRGFTPENF